MRVLRLAWIWDFSLVADICHVEMSGFVSVFSCHPVGRGSRSVVTRLSGDFLTAVVCQHDSIRRTIRGIIG